MKTLQPRTLYVDLDNPQSAYVYVELKAHPNSKHARGFILVHLDNETASTVFGTHYLEPGENFHERLEEELPENLAIAWQPGDTSTKLVRGEMIIRNTI